MSVNTLQARLKGRAALASALFFCLGYTAACPARAARDASPNVIFITIDTLRPDHLGCYGYTRIETPNIDAIARAGARFSHAYTPHPAGPRGNLHGQLSHGDGNARLQRKQASRERRNAGQGVARPRLRDRDQAEAEGEVLVLVHLPKPVCEDYHLRLDPLGRDTRLQTPHELWDSASKDPRADRHRMWARRQFAKQVANAGSPLASRAW